MARKYSSSASRDVESAVKRRNKGTLRSGKGGRGGKVTSRKQAIAIGLSEARKKGKKVPAKASRSSARTGAGKGAKKGVRKVAGKSTKKRAKKRA